MHIYIYIYCISSCKLDVTDCWGLGRQCCVGVYIAVGGIPFMPLPLSKIYSDDIWMDLRRITNVHATKWRMYGSSVHTVVFSAV